MTVRTALVATVKLIKEVAAERADRRDPQPRGGPADQFEPPDPRQDHGGGLGNASSGGGDPKGGTQIDWQR